jgi:ABC-type transporter Mla MlaB component
MPAARTNDDFKYYMHDGPTAYSFEIAGRISDNAARELAQVWKTASSTASGLALIVDLSYVTQVDEAGQRLLRDWYDGGAQLVAKRPHARTIVASITGQTFDRVDEPALHHTWRPLTAFLAVVVAMLVYPTTVLAARLLG